MQNISYGLGFVLTARIASFGVICLLVSVQFVQMFLFYSARKREIKRSVMTKLMPKLKTRKKMRLEILR